MTPEESIVIEIHKANLQGLLDSNKAMIEYTKMSIRGALLLNGAGILPIIASKNDALYPAAFWFAIGALFAVMAAGLSYLCQWGITAGYQTNMYDYPFRIAPLNQNQKIEVQNLNYQAKCADQCWRRLAIASLAVSLVCFALGLWNAYGDLMK